MLLSEPRACDRRIEELRSRMPLVLLRSRCVWTGEDSEDSSLAAVGW